MSSLLLSADGADNTLLCERLRHKIQTLAANRQTNKRRTRETDDTHSRTNTDTDINTDTHKAKRRATEHSQLIMNSILDSTSPSPSPSHTHVVDGAKQPTTQQLIHITQREQQKLENLRQHNPDKADQLLHVRAYTSSMLRASGVVVKDNPSLLKKTLKRSQQRKKKSALFWAEKNKAQQKEQAIRQAKRQDNIKKKIQRKKGSKHAKHRPTKQS